MQNWIQGMNVVPGPSGRIDFCRMSTLGQWSVPEVWASRRCQLCFCCTSASATDIWDAHFNVFTGGWDTLTHIPSPPLRCSSWQPPKMASRSTPCHSALCYKNPTHARISDPHWMEESHWRTPYSLDLVHQTTRHPWESPQLFRQPMDPNTLVQSLLPQPLLMRTPQ